MKASVKHIVCFIDDIDQVQAKKNPIDCHPVKIHTADGTRDGVMIPTEWLYHEFLRCTGFSEN